MKARKIQGFSIVIITLLLTLLFSLSVFADDELVPIDAEPINTDGTIYYGSFTEEKTEQYYSFYLPLSGTLEITLSKHENVHYQIYNLEGDYQVGSGVFTSTLQIFDIAAEAGHYLVKLYVDKGETGSYEFIVHYTPANETYEVPNNTMIQARDLPVLPLNKEVTGFFTKKYKDDFFKFKLTKSGRFTVKWGTKTEDIFNCGLELYDEDENLLFNKFYHSPYTTDTGETLTKDLHPGIYYLKFSDATRKHEGSYHFTPVFKASGETASTDVDSLKAAKSLKAVPLCETKKGQIAINDENDYYKSYIPKTGNYNLTVSGDKSYYSSGFPFDVESLLKADGSYFRAEYSIQDKSNPPVKTFVYRNLKKGTYYLHFFRSELYGGATGPYSFIMRPAPVEIYKPTAGKKSFTVSWAKGTGTGYQLQYALNSKFTSGKKSVTITKASTVKKTIKKLKAKKKYYIRVRSYVKYNGKKYYSLWSEVRTVKTKK